MMASSTFPTAHAAQVLACVPITSAAPLSTTWLRTAAALGYDRPWVRTVADHLRIGDGLSESLVAAGASKGQAARLAASVMSAQRASARDGFTQESDARAGIATMARSSIVALGASLVVLVVALCVTIASSSGPLPTLGTGAASALCGYGVFYAHQVRDRALARIRRATTLRTIVALFHSGHVVPAAGLNQESASKIVDGFTWKTVVADHGQDPELAGFLSTIPLGERSVDTWEGTAHVLCGQGQQHVQEATWRLSAIWVCAASLIAAMALLA
jgi:hypothetical protein